MNSQAHLGSVKKKYFQHKFLLAKLFTTVLLEQNKNGTEVEYMKSKVWNVWSLFPALKT